MVTTDNKKSYLAFQKLEDLYAELSKAALDAKQAVVTTAVSLTESQEKEIRQILLKKDPDLDITFSVNVHVVSGIRVMCGDWLFDATARSQLDHMAKEVKETHS